MTSAKDRTPEEWLSFLDSALEKRRPEIDKYTRYYDGDHPLRHFRTKFLQAFGRELKPFATNFCEKAIDGPVAELEIQGFNAETPETVKIVDGIWKANRLKSRSSILHSEASKAGVAYLLVDPTLTKGKAPRITVETADHCIVATDPGDSSLRLAGYKKWRDDEGYVHGIVYLADAIYKWISVAPVSAQIKSATTITLSPQKIEWREDYSIDHDLGDVPLVEIENNPSAKGGRSDLRVAIPLQDAINKAIQNMMVASEFMAFPQRVALGAKIPRDAAGNPVAGSDIKAALTSFLFIEDVDGTRPDVKSLPAADLDNFKNEIETYREIFCNLTSIPTYLFTSTIANVSVDTVGLVDKAFVGKIRGKQTSFSEGWTEVFRLALLAVGETQAANEYVEPRWRDTTFRSIAQVADAGLKYIQAGVPYEVVWAQLYGLTPDQIAAAKKIKNLPDVLVEEAATITETRPTVPGLQENNPVQAD